MPPWLRIVIALPVVMPPALVAQDVATPAVHEHADDGEIVGERSYRLAQYDSLTDQQRRELGRSTTPKAYESMRGDGGFVLRKLLYRSDGHRVVAYVYGGTQAGAAQQPVVIYNKGSYVTGDQAPVLLPVFHRLARAGFVVVAPQYRGSDDGEGHDDMGGADVNDVHNALKMVARLPGVDTTRAFLYGESRGGMMTYQALRDRMPVRAAAVVGAFTDLDSLLASDPGSRAAADMIWPAFEQDRASIALRRSAIKWAGALEVPLLILHGTADRQVSPRHAMRLALELDAKGRPYELHVMAGGSHTLAEQAALRDAMVIAWFTRYGQ